MIRKLIVHLIFYFCLFVGSIEAAEYFNFRYQVEEGDTFSSILKNFVKSDAQITSKTPLVGKIMKKNPQIQDWKNLKPGLYIQLYISPDVFDFEKYRMLEAVNITNIKEENKIIKKVTEIKTGWKGSAYYMLSSGTLKQTTSDGSTISSSRNSPLTAGMSLNYLPQNPQYSLATSAYICLLTSTKVNLNETNVPSPLEFGTTFYGEYRFLNKSFNVYSGLDFETLSGYNLQGTGTGQKIYVENSKFLFFTAGISNFFTIYNFPLFTKFSLSKSILSSYDGGGPSGTSTSLKYSGYKALFYLNYKFTDKLFLHSMIKYHTLSGPSKLSVLRIGAGVG